MCGSESMVWQRSIAEKLAQHPRACLALDEVRLAVEPGVPSVGSPLGQGAHRVCIHCRALSPAVLGPASGPYRFRPGGRYSPAFASATNR